LLREFFAESQEKSNNIQPFGLVGGNLTDTN